MSSFEHGALQGRGTGKRTVSTSSQDYIREERDLILGEIGNGLPSRPPSLLNALPPASLSRSGLPGLRDPKGKDTAIFDKTYTRPDERPWDKLDRAYVRHHATATPAVLLPKNVRQAAARDAGLEWDEGNRTYRPRRAATPAPRAATGDHAEGEGA